MRIAVLPGDGIGAEITAATLEALRSVDDGLKLGFEFEQHAVGLASLKATGSTKIRPRARPTSAGRWAPRLSPPRCARASAPN